MISFWSPPVITSRRVVTRDTTLIADLAFVRDQCLKITNGTAEDPYITAAIQAATDYAETYLERALGQLTVEYRLSQFPSLYQALALAVPLSPPFPSSVVQLPLPPFVSLDGIDYLDVSGAAQSVDIATVRIVTAGDTAKAALLPLFGTVWPMALGEPGSVTIRYHAGYSDPTQIPAAILQGVVLVVGQLYKQRSQSVDGQTTAAAILRAQDLWNGWKVY